MTFDLPKASWGAGPWQDEPDHVEWRDKDTGLPCMLHRNHGGALCGYVAVNPGHAMHGKDYDHVGVDVHGGLTYASKCNGPLCHVAAPGEPDDVWWLGFDCAHYRDYVPGYASRFPHDEDREVYRDVAYVQAECASLAKQLAAM